MFEFQFKFKFIQAQAAHAQLIAAASMAHLNPAAAIGISGYVGMPNAATHSLGASNILGQFGVS